MELVTSSKDKQVGQSGRRLWEPRAGFVLAPGEANVYAGFPAGVAAVKEETQVGFGDDE